MNDLVCSFACFIHSLYFRVSPVFWGYKDKQGRFLFQLGSPDSFYHWLLNSVWYVLRKGSATGAHRMTANPSLGTIQRDEKSLPEKCGRRNWSELGSRRGLVKAVGWYIGATEEVWWCGQAQ